MLLPDAVYQFRLFLGLGFRGGQSRAFLECSIPHQHRHQAKYGLKEKYDYSRNRNKRGKVRNKRGNLWYQNVVFFLEHFTTTIWFFRHIKICSNFVTFIPNLSTFIPVFRVLAPSVSLCSGLRIKSIQSWWIRWFQSRLKAVKYQRVMLWDEQKKGR